MTLSVYFQNNALFQADASLTLRGQGAPNVRYEVAIKHEDVRCVGAQTTSDEEGNFCLTIDKTPKASFVPYTITVSGNDECRMIENVLFGELWLCSGQSNMELFNRFQPGYKCFLAEVSTKNIRVLLTGNPGFTYDPIYQGVCQWTDVSNQVAMENVSALGLKCLSSVYDSLNANAKVPVGFIYATYGGVPLASFLPRDAIEQDPEILALLKKNGKYPSRDEYQPSSNATCAQYNSKMASLEGIKVRGILWYQGENETATEYYSKSYAACFRFYHKVYSERFGADPDDCKIIFSLIYPMAYGVSGECNVGYINHAFIQMATENPAVFTAVPNGDLSGIWSGSEVKGVNFPIHPINKYPIGDRMAKLVIRNVYGGDDEQNAAAYLKEWKVEGNKVKLTFASVGSGLFVDTKYSAANQPIGLYVAGADGIYLPAQCRVESADTLLVWCDEIEAPVHVAYSAQSMEIRCNLWAGSYPVLPFFTDTETQLNIQARPWYDTTRQSVWVYTDNLCFYRPIWQSLVNSEVCHDDANTREEQSVRVNALETEKEFGCYLTSYSYNELDLGKFNKLTVALYANSNVEPKLVIDADQEVELVKTEDYGDGWADYEADLSSVEDAKTLAFVFKAERPHDYVNIEHVRLSV